MSAQDHNKTLGIIFGSLGGLLVLAAAVELIRVIALEKELSRIRSDSFLQVLILVALGLTTLLITTAYGIFKRKPWARGPALVVSALTVWLFPLGTALAIYAWWVMHSEEVKRLYSRPPL